MTTARSPIHLLRAQATKIAEMLKAAERGQAPAIPYASKIAAARMRNGIKFGVAMDDKILEITMGWQTIRETETEALAEFVLKQMLSTDATPEGRH